MINAVKEGFYNSIDVSVWQWIRRMLWVYIGIFIVTQTISVWFGSQFLENFFCLSTAVSGWSQPWRFFTYSFLHSDFWHIFFNLSLFYGLARFLLQYEVSLKKFFCIYFLGIIIGGWLWWVFHRNEPCHFLNGASAGISALLTYFCFLYPRKSLSLFVFLVFPIQLQARWLLVFLSAYELLSGLFYELPGITHIAHSAHLGGMLVGFLAFYVQKHHKRILFRSQSIETIRYRVNREFRGNDNDMTPFDIFKKLQIQDVNV